MPSPTDYVSNLQITTEDSTVYQLYGLPIHFISLDGVGMMPTRQIVQRLPQQHGVKSRYHRLDPRRMTLTLGIEATTTAEADSLRDRLAYIFAPTFNPLKLTATKMDGTQRRIDCYLDGQMDFPQSVRVGAYQPVVIPLLAPNPTWYYPTQQSQSISLTHLGGGTYLGTITVDCAGLTANDYPVVRVSGQINFGGLTVKVGSTTIASVGGSTPLTQIPSGETWEFDFRPGFRTVRRTSDNANRLNGVNSNFNQFMLVRVLSEKNVRVITPTATTMTFEVLGTSGSGTPQLQVSYYKRYASL